MAEHWFNEKINLLKQFHDHTLTQLQAVQNEDPDRFLAAVEACEPLMQEIDRINQQHSGEEMSKDHQHVFNELLQQIQQLREQISEPSAELHKKLQQGAAAEQRTSQFNKAYGNEPYAVPSVFYDKRK